MFCKSPECFVDKSFKILCGFSGSFREKSKTVRNATASEKFVKKHFLRNFDEILHLLLLSYVNFSPNR